MGGYGTLYAIDIYRTNTKKYNQRAHRIAWEFENGPVPDGMCVCHSCDNPPCCNPKHLFLGSHQDNTQDMMKKGRHNPRGPHKLTDKEILEIREQAKEGVHQVYLAETYEVSQSMISNIVRRKIRI